MASIGTELTLTSPHFRKLGNQMNYLSQTTQKEKDDLEKLKATQVGDEMILVVS